MIELNGGKVLIGGFHEHWHRIDTENTAYLLAALNYYGYDFVTLMDGYEQSAKFQIEAAKYTDAIKLHPGRESGCPWGHVVTVGFKNNRAEDEVYHELAVISEVDKAFEFLRESYDLVVLAHPDYDITWRDIFLTGELDRLLDDGVIDAVNLINTSGFSHERHKTLIDWYMERERSGKRTPIVGGWDAHLMVSKINDPEILYTAAAPPKGHIDTAGSNRTIVIDAENDLSSIIQAVKECRTVIEDIETGGLVGPERWLEFLRSGGYRGKTAEIAAAREAVNVSKPGKWLLNDSAEIVFNQNGTVLYPAAGGEAERIVVAAGEPAKLADVGLNIVRDEVGIPVVFSNEKGFEAIYAVRAFHPIRVDVLPKYDDGKAYMEIRFAIPFEGELTIRSRLFESPLMLDVPKERSELLVEVSPTDTYPVSYSIDAVNSNGLGRRIDGIVTFYPVERFEGDWNSVPVIGIDREEFAPRELGYANTEPWLGPELFSGAVQMAWTKRALLFRVDVTDPIHDQPLEGHFTYDADCVQIAVDPLNLRRKYRGHFYNYNLALTRKGPELYQMFTPDLDVDDNPISIPQDRSLGDEHLSVEMKENGLIYYLALPWSLLGVSMPSPGDRMGVYFILLNSNGNGVINNLRWPTVIPGLWMIPEKWGTITFV